MHTELGPRYELAKRIAALASHLVLDYFRSDIAVDRKVDSSPVTDADREAENLLRREIQRAYPDDGIVGEEWGTVAGSSSYRWILDPIDDTKSFIQGVPLFGTMVAVEQAGRGKIGVVTFPALGVTIDAVVEGGAWETRADGSRVPARVARTAAIEDGVVVTTDWEGFAERGALAAFEGLGRSAWYLRTWGDCYGYYLVATGRAVAMIDARLNIWDAAALQPIMEEAGGTFTDWRGNPTIDGGEGVGTNGLVLQELLQILNPPAIQT